MSKRKEVRRLIDVPCDACFGTGRAVGGVNCGTCKGSGNVKRPVVEIVWESEVTTK